MSINDVIRKFEDEKKEIPDKIAALKERDAVLDMLLKELRSAAGGRSKASAKKAAKSSGKKKRTRKKKGGMTVREAILKTVAGASAPLRAGEIIEKSVSLSGGAEASVRTQINALTKGGELAQVPFKGRGFKYRLAGAKKAEPKAPAKPKE